MSYGNETMILDAKAYNEVEQLRERGQEYKVYEKIIEYLEQKIELLKERKERLKAELRDAQADAHNSNVAFSDDNNQRAS